MKKILLVWMGSVLLAALTGVAAAQTPTPQPVATKSASAPVTYDTFILKRKGQNMLQMFPDIDDENVKLVKPSDEELVTANQQLDEWKERLGKFELQLGLGGDPTLSKNLTTTYTTGFSFDIGIGHRFSPQFSLLLNFDGALFGLNNDEWNGNLKLNNINIALLAKLRFASEGIRPYLFAGPGLGLWTYSFKYTTNGINGDNSLYDGVFMAEGGVGIEAPVAKFIYLFLQVKAVCQFIDSNFASYTDIDTSSAYLPIEFGVTFAK